MDERSKEIEDARQARPLPMAKVNGRWIAILEMEARQAEIDEARNIIKANSER